MPILVNPRYERFAQELANGKSASEAYVLAGYKENRGNASSLKQQEIISNRVDEILAERIKAHAKATEKAIERLSVDREWVLARLIENAQAASAKEDFSPANRALELVGKELGMFIDRKHIDLDGELRGFSDAQLIAFLAGSGSDGDD